MVMLARLLCKYLHRATWQRTVPLHKVLLWIFLSACPFLLTLLEKGKTENFYGAESKSYCNLSFTCCVLGSDL